MLKNLQFEKDFYFIVGLLIFIAFLMHWDMRMHILSSNGDDLRFIFKGMEFDNHGIANYYEHALDLAKHQGRFYFVVTLIFAELPHFIPWDTLRAFIITTLYFLAGVSVSTVLYSFYKSEKLAIVFFLLFLFFVPVYGAWYAFFHWTIYWMVPIILFGFAFSLHSRLLTSEKNKPVGLAIGFSIMTFLSILFSEMYFLGFSFILFINYLRHKQVYNFQQLFQKLITGRFFITILPFIIYLICYLSFHRTSSTAGNRVSSKLAFIFDINAIFNAFSTFMISALPINYESVSYAGTNWLVFLKENPIDSSPNLFFFFLVLMFVSYLFFKVFSVESNAKSISLKTRESKFFKFSAIILPILAGISFAILQVFTVTYQNWLANYRPWYTPTFHISLGLLASASFVITRYFPFNFPSKGIRYLLNFCLIIMISLCLFVSYNSYMFTSGKVKERNLDLHLLYKLRNSNYLSLIPEGATIYFPKLTLATHLNGQSFLSELFRKEIEFVKNLEDIEELPEKGLFAIKLYYENGLDDVDLLVGKVSNITEFKEFEVSEVISIPYISANDKTITTPSTVDKTKLSFIRSQNEIVKKSLDGIVAKFPKPVLFNEISVVSRIGTLKSRKKEAKDIEWTKCKLRLNRKTSSFQNYCPSTGIADFKIKTDSCMIYKIDIDYLPRRTKKYDRSKKLSYEVIIYIDDLIVAKETIQDFTNTSLNESLNSIQLCSGTHQLSYNIKDDNNQTPDNIDLVFNLFDLSPL